MESTGNHHLTGAAPPKFTNPFDPVTPNPHDYSKNPIPDNPPSSQPTETHNHLTLSNASNPNPNQPNSPFIATQQRNYHMINDNDLFIAKTLGIDEKDCIEFVEKTSSVERTATANEDFTYSGPPALLLVSKLRHFKKVIKSWAANLKVKEGEFEATLWQDLTSLEEVAENRNLSEDEEWAFGECKKNILELEVSRIKDKWQRSRVKWASHGDNNSSFFHSCINARVASNRIHGIDINGSLITKPNIIKREVRRFFSSRFKDDTQSRPSFACPGERNSLDLEVEKVSESAAGTFSTSAMFGPYRLCTVKQQ
ncbi:hypothetical protein QVD17_30129 [Tagetes erecta]|uniref:Uncharacterized protein n=1 Tax=Tagetes erecta TaxID=13708 RepID=A0AAD8K7D9_TARER|nr:hypothetical protein QVD17_30129 [Tagetes erecta]